MDASKIRIIGKGVELTESDMAQVYALAIKLLSAKLSGKVLTLDLFYDEMMRPDAESEAA